MRGRCRRQRQNLKPEVSPVARTLGILPTSAPCSPPSNATSGTSTPHSPNQGNAVKGVLGTNNPSKRIADPLEIAKLAVYLASDDSAYVVGADFLIDGGVTAISAVGA